MTKPLQTSSGDLLADRRADYAEMLFAAGDHMAAAELMLNALELAPDWSFGWFRLGEFQEAAGVMPAAIEAWRTALKLDPADRSGAALKLRLAGIQADAAGSGFVETLFDQYAGSFDEALVEKLGYRVPDLLDAAIARHQPGRFLFAIDLGCGTGLMGERLRPRTDRLEGYDISAEMLRKADAKKLYDRLVKADLETMQHAGDGADLVTAADVFMYVGAYEVPGPSRRNTDDADMVGDVREMEQKLKSRGYPSLRVASSVLEDEDHLTVAPVGFTRALMAVLPAQGD